MPAFNQRVLATASNKDGICLYSNPIGTSARGAGGNWAIKVEFCSR